MKDKTKNWKLRQGDVVDIIAPASHTPEDKLEEGIEWLKSLGLVPRVPKGLIKPDLFFASPLEDQLSHLVKALSSDSKAIWCLRGGYGSMRLIPFLEKISPQFKPKMFIGFSDITSLHLFFNQTWNWPTLHGKTLSQLSLKNRASDQRELKKIIFGEITEKTFKKLKPLNTVAIKENVIEGKIIGGNLRILQSSLGTSWQLRAKGKILFIEDVAERGYSIDRMLEQLHQAKIIDKGLKAIIFGDFTGGEEKDGSDFTQEALKRFAERVNYPVFAGLPCGHSKQNNSTLPFNTSCQLITGRKSELRCKYS